MNLTDTSISCQEIRRAFLYHYSRCGIDEATASGVWQRAESDPSGIVLYTERSTGTLRAYYKTNPDPNQPTFADGSPIPETPKEPVASQESWGYF